MPQAPGGAGQTAAAAKTARVSLLLGQIYQCEKEDNRISVFQT